MLRERLFPSFVKYKTNVAPLVRIKKKPRNLLRHALHVFVSKCLEAHTKSAPPTPRFLSEGNFLDVLGAHPFLNVVKHKPKPVPLAHVFFFSPEKCEGTGFSFSWRASGPWAVAGWNQNGGPHLFFRVRH